MLINDPMKTSLVDEDTWIARARTELAGKSPAVYASRLGILILDYISRFGPARVVEVRMALTRPSTTLSIAAIRQARGVSQAGLAPLFGISQGALSFFERGVARRLEKLRRYVTTLGGQLEVAAVFPDGTRFLIEGSSEPDTSIGANSDLPPITDDDLLPVGAVRAQAGAARSPK